MLVVASPSVLREGQGQAGGEAWRGRGEPGALLSLLPAVIRHGSQTAAVHLQGTREVGPGGRRTSVPTTRALNGLSC